MGLIAWAVVDAFPEECKAILPKELRRVRKELKEYLDKIEDIQESYIDDFERYFWVEAVKILMPCDKKRLYYQLLEIQKLHNIRNKVGVMGKLDIIGAKNKPIERLHNFDKVRNGMYSCPFHKENHGSFKIYRNTNTWHCFGACGVGGDSIDFIMKLNNYNFIEAVKYLTGGNHGR